MALKWLETMMIWTFWKRNVSHPLWVRHGVFKILCKWTSCFNLRTCKGCDLRHTLFDLHHLAVSIHAPIKDATEGDSLCVTAEAVSIHAPIKDATSGRLRLLPLPKRFNPRTHKGCDYMLVQRDRSFDGFNPRTHKGCDFSLKLCCGSGRFQSTHP